MRRLKKKKKPARLPLKLKKPPTQLLRHQPKRHLPRKLLQNNLQALSA